MSTQFGYNNAQRGGNATNNNNNITLRRAVASTSVANTSNSNNGNINIKNLSNDQKQFLKNLIKFLRNTTVPNRNEYSIIIYLKEIINRNGVPITNKAKSIISLVGINFSSINTIQKNLFNNVNGYNTVPNKTTQSKVILSLLKQLSDKRVKRDTELTNSTMITHLLGNDIKRHKPENLKRVANQIRRNNGSNKQVGKLFTFEFNATQETEFFNYMLADITHDGGYYTVEQLKEIRKEIKKILFKANENNNTINISKIFKNDPNLTISKGVRTAQYAKKKVDNAARATLKNFLSNNNTIIIKSHSDIKRNGKDLVRYKIGNKRYYKKFNVILNANQSDVFKKFLQSLYYKNNRKIGTFVVCPAQTVNSGFFKTSLEPVRTMIAKIMNNNFRDLSEFNSKRMNVVLKFPNNKKFSLELRFNAITRKYEVSINGQNPFSYTTAKNSAAGNPRIKLQKFLGDFMMILKVIIETGDKKRPVAFATTDNMAALIYVFMCRVHNVKPRLFFTTYKKLEKSMAEQTLYIYGMNDIISKQCQRVSKTDRATRKRKPSKVVTNRQKIVNKFGTNNITSATNINSNSNNNRR